MSRRPTNSWHRAICDQLRDARGALTVDQIWRGMLASGFHHASADPKSTIGGRLAELRKRGTITRVAPATYQLATEAA